MEDKQQKLFNKANYRIDRWFVAKRVQSLGHIVSFSTPKRLTFHQNLKPQGCVVDIKNRRDHIRAFVLDAGFFKFIQTGNFSDTNDIAGAASAGIKTCWLDRGGELPESGAAPDWSISSISGLRSILSNGPTLPGST